MDSKSSPPVTLGGSPPPIAWGSYPQAVFLLPPCKFQEPSRTPSTPEPVSYTHLTLPTILLV
eukprot:4004464-Amphidinium_carterae.2